jgi:outer membrane protein OmpA-like peptidoglycan-associated protein
MEQGRIRQCVMFASVLVAVLALSPLVFADADIRAVITGRGNDGTLTVRADDASVLTVVLSEVTRITRTDGLREERADAATLIPGLRVQLKGAPEGANRFTATRISFSRDDLKMALAIYGGVETTDRRSLENRQRIEQNARGIEQHQQTLDLQSQQLASQSERLRANEEKIVGTSGALAATNARIANLDDYDVVSTMTVFFRNGRASIDPRYRAQLQEFAAQARDKPGYMIQVEGHASAVGPYDLNQRLSAERANAVAAVLQQSGIPPTKMLWPAAMGVSNQVATNTTAQGQAENRRTVISVLQNKGITGQ